MSTEEILGWIRDTVAAMKPEMDGRIGDDATFEADLGMDSLDMVDLLTHAESRFGIAIPDSRLSGIERVRDLADHVADRVRAG
jgi:acyl carrier protein